MSVNAPLIQATDLNRYYGDYHAVDAFNLTLNKGDILGLLGPNGAGKSSTMQMLTGNISPSSGVILIKGANLTNEPEDAKQAIGYLPEQPPIYRDMTVIEYLNYCAALRGISSAEKTSLIAESSKRCGLLDAQKKLIGNLSKGFQQRVGIAQAILHKPDVVILDEPTVGLDPLQINQIRHLIRELGKDHAVILSTHILPEVQAVCNRVQIINRGKTVFSDSFDKLAERQNSNELLVSFQGEVQTNALEEITGVSHIEQFSSDANESRFRIFSQEKNVASDIFKLSAKQGWQLIELSPQYQSLEQTFMNLVYSEQENPELDDQLEEEL